MAPENPFRFSRVGVLYAQADLSLLVVVLFVGFVIHWLIYEFRKGNYSMDTQISLPSEGKILARKLTG